MTPAIMAGVMSFHESVPNEQPDEELKSVNWAVFDVPLEVSAKNTSIDGKGMSKPN